MAGFFEPGSGHGRLSRTRLWLVFGGIALIMLVMTLYRLGYRDVCSGNEAVEGVFVQQIVEHGKLLFPLENGSIPMYKPPMFHWTATAIDHLFGFAKVTAFNLRLPSVLYAIAGLLLAMVFAYGVLGIDGAMVAGLTLAGSYQYITEGRFGRVDMTLTFFETLALFSFFWWMGPKPSESEAAVMRWDKGRGFQYLCALAVGLAVLAKGPVGAILPLGAAGIFVIVERRFGEMMRRLDPPALVLAIVLSGSWYFACWAGGRYGLLSRQIGSENFGRFFGALGTMPPWYYVKPLFLNSVPFSLFVPVAVLALLYGWPAMPSPPPSASGERRPDRAEQAARLCAIFWIVTLVFFEIAAYKRRAYLLPLWPAAAVMLAWLARGLVLRYGRRLVLGTFVALSFVAIVFNFIYIPYKEARACPGEPFRLVARDINRAVGSKEPLYTYGFHEQIAPLLFYLDRNAPRIKTGRLGEAPPGYIIVPMQVWLKQRHEAPGLVPVLSSSHGNLHVVLLHRGKIYADAETPESGIPGYPRGPNHAECVAAEGVRQEFQLATR